ncbi:hypothetical protein SDJN03_07379, partial [Cucurbita argyrosperma subsp. sororia]
MASSIQLNSISEIPRDLLFGRRQLHEYPQAYLPTISRIIMLIASSTSMRTKAPSYQQFFMLLIIGQKSPSYYRSVLHYGSSFDFESLVLFLTDIRNEPGVSIAT